MMIIDIDCCMVLCVVGCGSVVPTYLSPLLSASTTVVDGNAVATATRHSAVERSTGRSIMLVQLNGDWSFMNIGCWVSGSGFLSSLMMNGSSGRECVCVDLFGSHRLVGYTLRYAPGLKSSQSIGCRPTPLYAYVVVRSTWTSWSS